MALFDGIKNFFGFGNEDPNAIDITIDPQLNTGDVNFDIPEIPQIPQQPIELNDRVQDIGQFENDRTFFGDAGQAIDGFYEGESNNVRANDVVGESLYGDDFYSQQEQTQDFVDSLKVGENQNVFSKAYENFTQTFGELGNTVANTSIQDIREADEEKRLQTARINEEKDLISQIATNDAFQGLSNPEESFTTYQSFGGGLDKQGFLNSYSEMISQGATLFEEIEKNRLDRDALASQFNIDRGDSNDERIGRLEDKLLQAYNAGDIDETEYSFLSQQYAGWANRRFSEIDIYQDSMERALAGTLVIEGNNTDELTSMVRDSAEYIKGVKNQEEKLVNAILDGQYSSDWLKAQIQEGNPELSERLEKQGYSGLGPTEGEYMNAFLNMNTGKLGGLTGLIVDNQKLSVEENLQLYQTAFNEKNITGNFSKTIGNEKGILRKGLSIGGQLLTLGGGALTPVGQAADGVVDGLWRNGTAHEFMAQTSSSLTSNARSIDYYSENGLPETFGREFTMGIADVSGNLLPAVLMTVASGGLGGTVSKAVTPQQFLKLGVSSKRASQLARAGQVVTRIGISEPLIESSLIRLDPESSSRASQQFAGGALAGGAMMESVFDITKGLKRIYDGGSTADAKALETIRKFAGTEGVDKASVDTITALSDYYIQGMKTIQDPAQKAEFDAFFKQGYGQAKYNNEMVLDLLEEGVVSRSQVTQWKNGDAAAKQGIEDALTSGIINNQRKTDVADNINSMINNTSKTFSDMLYDDGINIGATNSKLIDPTLGTRSKQPVYAVKASVAKSFEDAGIQKPITTDTVYTKKELIKLGSNSSGQTFDIGKRNNNGDFEFFKKEGDGYILDVRKLGDEAGIRKFFTSNDDFKQIVESENSLIDAMRKVNKQDIEAGRGDVTFKNIDKIFESGVYEKMDKVLSKILC